MHRPLLRVPQLAIHLDRGVNQGLKLDPQAAPRPVWGLGDPLAGEVVEFVATEAGVDPTDVAAHDLVLHDLTPPAPLGLAQISSPPRGWTTWSRCTPVTALIATRDSDTVPVLVAFDHEEVGSASATGAAGPLLETVLTRLAGGYDVRDAVFAGSRALSVDVTHATHPNYRATTSPGTGAAERRPALKVNANQRYATDAPGAAAWARACQDAGVPSQVFVSRNTVPCGSTVGPIIATRLGIHGGRRHPGAVDALRSRAVRCRGPGTPRGGRDGLPRRPAISRSASSSADLRRATRRRHGCWRAGGMRMPSTVVDHSGSPTDTDTGLFGPQSLTWRVHLEPVLFVGGLQALILQALHPWVMLGTYQNSALFDPAKAWALPAHG